MYTKPFTRASTEPQWKVGINPRAENTVESTPLTSNMIPKGFLNNSERFDPKNRRPLKTLNWSTFWSKISFNVIKPFALKIQPKVGLTIEFQIGQKKRLETTKISKILTKNLHFLQPRIGLQRPKTIPKYFLNNFLTHLKNREKLIFVTPKYVKSLMQTWEKVRILYQLFMNEL